MTENDRNTRTLIVCFVMAMMALIPLRVVEMGQSLNQARVLGETEEVLTNVVIEEVDETETEIETITDEQMLVDEEGIANGDELILEEVEEVVLPNADLE